MAASSAAFAGADVYGQARVAYTDSNTATGDVASQASRIGVKGSEDLGGGMSAVYGLEWAVDLGTAGSAMTGRNQFVGLKGGFGTVLTGAHDTPYKMGGSADVFADTAADATGSHNGVNGIIGRNALDNRASNAIAYISPDFNGFHVAAAIVTRDSNTTGLSALHATSVTAVYNNGPLKATLGQESFKNAQKGTKFNIGYKIGDIGLGYTYEQSQRAIAAVAAVAPVTGVFAHIVNATGVTTTSATLNDADALTTDLTVTAPVTEVTAVTAATHATKDNAHLMSVTYGMGPITLAAQYGKFDDKVGTAGVTRSTVGAVYALSKKTNVALAYTKDNNETAADTNATTLQLNHSF